MIDWLMAETSSSNWSLVLFGLFNTGIFWMATWMMKEGSEDVETAIGYYLAAKEVWSDILEEKGPRDEHE